ncbi:MAG: metallopeptidase family protein [Micropruina sp.]|nr:metallopeptidase family protein [Micropruina sp.]
MPVSMSEERFEQLVDQALDQIPAELASLVQNCVLVIEPRASEPDPDLLGYYDGIPLSERDSHYAGVLPDRILIFRDAILQLCESEAQVVDEVRITVWHEVAHYFGIDDERLHDLGYA